MPSLEITTMVGCPLKCTFCPQDALRTAYGKDPDKYMSLGNFKVILSKVPDYVRIDFSGMSEPWANDDCTAMLRHALEEGYRVAVYTTLYGITLPDAKQIIALLDKYAHQIETLCLHLPDGNGNMRGFKYSAEYGKVLKLFLQFGDTQRVYFQAMTMDKGGEVHDRLRSSVKELDGWVGLTRAGSLDTAQIGEQPIEATPHYDTPVSCSYTPFYDQNVVLPSGDVVLCCMDYSMKHVIGNLLTGDYWSLFDSSSMRSLQAENRKCGNAGTSICKSCTRATRYSLAPGNHQTWVDDGATMNYSDSLRTMDAWHKVHQPFEIDWWKKHLPGGHCDDPGFTIQWDEVREFIEPHGDILDVGCGPRPPFVPCAVIEPLANAYQEIVPKEWWEGVTAYAQPAEVLIHNLRADTVICWNAIDHTIGWRTILDNILAYGRPGARFAIATDFYKPFVGHPGFPREEFMTEIHKRFHIHKEREPFGRALALLMTAKTT